MKKRFFRIISVATLMVIMVGMTLGTATKAHAFSEEEFEQLVSETKDKLSSQKEYSKDDLMSFSFENATSPLDASSFYAALDNLYMGTLSCLKYDIQKANVSNTNALNLEYLSLLTELKDAGYGSTSELNIPEMKTGYTSSIAETFKDTFGDLSGKYTDNTQEFMDAATAKITLESTLASSGENRDAQDIKGTEIYKTVLGNISAGNVITSAQTTLETPELKTPLQLSELLNSNAQSTQDVWTQKQQDALDKINEIAISNKTNANIMSSEDLQDMFDKSTDATEAWLSRNTGTAEYNVFDKMTSVFGENSTVIIGAFLGGKLDSYDGIMSIFGDYVDVNADAPESSSVGSLIDWVDRNWDDSAFNPDNHRPPADTKEEQETQKAWNKIVLNKKDPDALANGYEAKLRDLFGSYDIPHWKDYPDMAAYEAAVKKVVGSTSVMTFGEYLISQGGF